jgi:UDP-glucose 4-epimerase
MKNNRQRLFEVIARLDKTFKLNEDIDDKFQAMDSFVSEANGKQLNNQAVEDVLNIANQKFGGFGVEEIIDDNEYVDENYENTIALYVDMNQTNVKTIIYDTVNKTFLAMSWLDFIEKQDNYFGSNEPEEDLDEEFSDDPHNYAAGLGDDYEDGV